MPDRERRPADPLLLLPLRLEYRVVELGEEVRLGTTPAGARGPVRDGSGPVTVSALGSRSPLRFDDTKMDRRKIWIRWLPDEPFAHEGVARPTSDEQAAVAQFVAAVEQAGAVWFDTENPEVAAAWQALAGEVGVSRAVHLMRSRGAPPDTDLEEAIGRIVGLPARVSVFGLIDTSLVHIATGGPIIDELRYTPAALGAGSWLTSFPDAIAAGMGVEVIDPDLVTAALDADWVIAAGAREGDATHILESYLRDAVANGNFELLEQDAPTNNSDGVRTSYDPSSRDPLAALYAATHAERRAPTGTTDAEVLATALGVDAGIVRSALGAGRDGVGHAHAMANALLPGLVNVLFSWMSELRVGSRELIDFLSAYLSARGPLPAIRLDAQPFGILPIVAPAQVTAPAGMVESRRRAFGFVSKLGSTGVEALADVALQQPVIEPGATDNRERLDQILRLNAVAKRIDVLDAASEDPKRRAMRCPLVEGPDHAPADYLQVLVSTPLPELSDPDQTDSHQPLLYRLLRLSLERTAAQLPPSLRQLSLARMVESAPPADKPWLSALLAAFDRLRGLRRDQLEVLMMEVIDLLHHRSDAWITATATARLADQRTQAPTGLQVGYYGLLGKLRPDSATGSTGGYIQTPTIDQATTAALLRSAGRRHGDTSAFDINLSSRRVRRALSLIDLLREGLSPREVLGYRAERWLHDQAEDLLIHELRARYPLPHGEGSNVDQERLMDGLAVAEGSDDDLSGLGQEQLDTVRRLRAQLGDDLDAMSDLTVAEAVHQMALGNTGAANAWINVLSGEPVPARAAFVATRRDGRGSTHRYSLVLDPRVMPGDHPREIVEPAVGRLAERLLDGFGSCSVSVSVPRRGGGPALTRHLRLRADLGMRPVDLVVGGRNEVMLRARHHMVRLWQTRPAVQAELGAPPPAELVTHINQVQPITVDLDHGTPSAETLCATARRIGQLVGEGRGLEATDVNAAMPPDERLDEAEIVEAMSASIAALASRAEKLSVQLTTLSADLTGALDRLRLAAAEAERLGQAGAPEPQMEAARDELSDARKMLESALLHSSWFGLPEALLPFSTEHLVLGGAANDHIRRFEAISALLDSKRAGIDAALALASPAPTTQRQAEQLRSRLIAALQATCDGQGLAVLPPFRKQSQTSPTLQAVPDIASELAPHLVLRPRMRTLAWLVDHDPRQRAWRSTEDATADADGPAAGDSIRTEDERPRSHHFGVYVGLDNGILGSGNNTHYCGLVVDEWSEFRPSMIQKTGMAINYDAPQAEPPHTLLLGVAPNDDHDEWTDDSAAHLVAEAIRLMQHRALPATEASRRQYFGALFNVVPPAGSGRRRIPTINYRLTQSLDALANLVEPVDRIPTETKTVHALIERRHGA